MLCAQYALRTHIRRIADDVAAARYGFVRASVTQHQIQLKCRMFSLRTRTHIAHRKRIRCLGLRLRFVWCRRSYEPTSSLRRSSTVAQEQNQPEPNTNTNSEQHPTSNIQFAHIVRIEATLRKPTETCASLPTPTYDDDDVDVTFSIFLQPNAAREHIARHNNAHNTLDVGWLIAILR